MVIAISKYNFCPVCTNSYGVICNCDIENLLYRSEAIDLGYVYPKNTFLISDSGKQGRIYGDETPMIIVDDEEV